MFHSLNANKKAYLFQLVENERHLGQVNEGKGWLVTFQASVLLVMDQRPEEILASSLHADWVTSLCMASLGLSYLQMLQNCYYFLTNYKIL